MGKVAIRSDRWWLAGGISPANCVAAYQAVGAHGFADSFINRNNPGVHDLTMGIIPEFSTSFGWKFTHPTYPNTYLISDIIEDTVNQNWSVSVCFKDVVYGNPLFGLNSGVTYNTFYITNAVVYWSGHYKSRSTSPALTAGVLGMAGKQGYRDGVPDGAVMASGGAANANEPLYIGAVFDGTTYHYPLGGTISSIAFYNTTLTDAQMLALRNAQVTLAAATYPYYGKAIAVIGDSKTVGTNGNWWPLLYRYIQSVDLVEVGYPNGTWDGRAYGGRTTAGIATEIAGILAGQHATPDPIACLYNLGVNDMAALPTEATFKTNCQTILTAIHTKWPTTPIYMCKLWRGDGTTYATEIASINTWITDIIAANPTYCHAGHDETVWAKGSDNGATMIAADDLHYSAAGNVECYNQWKAILGY